MSYLSDDEWEVVKEPLDMEGTDNLEHSCLAPGVKRVSPTLCYIQFNQCSD